MIKNVPKNLWQALNLAWELGFIIAIPLVILGSIGKYADGYYGTAPWFTLAAVFFAMAISTLWLYRQLKFLTGLEGHDKKVENSNQKSNSV